MLGPEELKHPPPTEFDLRLERLRKEKRWRREEQGWRLTRPGAGIVWDDRFQNSLRVLELRDPGALEQPRVETDGSSSSQS